MNKNHNLAIFEAGISKPGEMEKLETIIKPTIGIITNIGPPHSENFESNKQKTKEKLKLFKDADTLIYCGDYPDILKEIGRQKTDAQFLVGFAAETNDLEAHALAKMKKKNLDMIAANLVGGADSGFKSDTNKVKLFSRNGSVEDIPLMDKEKVGHLLLDAILKQIG